MLHGGILYLLQRGVAGQGLFSIAEMSFSRMYSFCRVCDFLALAYLIEAALISILITTPNSILSTSRWSLYSFETSYIVLLISSTYSLSVKKMVFNFQKSGPLGLVVVLILTVIIR